MLKGCRRATLNKVAYLLCMVLSKVITPQAGPTTFGQTRRHARTIIVPLLCHFALWDGKANRMSQMLVLHVSLGTHAVAAAAAPIPSSNK